MVDVGFNPSTGNVLFKDGHVCEGCCTDFPWGPGTEGDCCHCFGEDQSPAFATVIFKDVLECFSFGGDAINGVHVLPFLPASCPDTIGVHTCTWISDDGRVQLTYGGAGNPGITIEGLTDDAGTNRSAFSGNFTDGTCEGTYCGDMSNTNTCPGSPINFNSGLDGTAYWALGQFPQWVISTSYSVNDLVSNIDTFYRCIQAHVSNADREPGVGVDWEDYWKLVC